MERQQALKTLALSDGATADEINSAYQSKTTLIAEKQQSAPTEALKQKFAKLKTELEQAHQLLIASSVNQQVSAHSASPLSQTKMADLPGMASTINNQPSLEVGTVLADRYEIKTFIAQGGMGAVYRAFDKNRNEDIAIKVMLPQLMSDERAKARFLDEARLSSQLSHPSIVNVFDVQQSDGLCFLTMELLEGQDLRQLIENKALVRQHFSLEEVLEILTPICAALDHAHEITVHRDIKPENIYLTDEGKYKLMDFGIARIMSTSQRTQTGAASGTAYYMAPEQLKGVKNIDGRADQYALAVLVYELLSGDVPAGAIEPLHELVKGISKKVSLSVQKALSPKPENRFDNISEFLNALQGTGKNSAMPSLRIKNIGIAAAVLIAILGLSMAATNGSLDNIWQALKPVDKALIATQKADIAKLQGEIKNYQKRLEKGQRNLNSEVRDAQRNNSNVLKKLQYWQRLTDDYLFEGSELTDLEGELSKGENLLRQDTELTIEQAGQVLTQVRDGYKTLWAEFNAAEYLFDAQASNQSAFAQWVKYKEQQQLANPTEITDASTSEEQAKTSLREGAFTKALTHWQQAEKQWQVVNQVSSALVKAKDANNVAFKAWDKRQKRYSLSNSTEAIQAAQSETLAQRKQMEGDFVAAKQDLQTATGLWEQAYKTVETQVTAIEAKRLAAKKEATRLANIKAAKEAKRLADAKEAKRLAYVKEAKRLADAEEAKRLAAKITGKMVNIPAGSFMMGAPEAGFLEVSFGNPLHRVRVSAFKMSQTEVTFAAWDACYSARACDNAYELRWSEGDRDPVSSVSYEQITEQFIPWLNKVAGVSGKQVYRLPTEAEWEYAARAGSKSKYSWGDSLGHNRANCDGCGSQWDDRRPAPVKSFAANGFGLYDMHGNVWEWTQDCWHKSYHGAPSDGSAWVEGDCRMRTTRGGSWYSSPGSVISASRFSHNVSSDSSGIGFRLAQSY